METEIKAKKFSGLTVERFIERSNKTHNNRYDYSESKFRAANKIIRIKCPTHGYFHEMAGRHSANMNYGCPKCTPDFIYREKKVVEDRARWLAVVTEKYGDTMDFSKAVYERHRSPMVVHCNIHNQDFKTTADMIRISAACPGCKEQRLADRRNAKVKIVYNIPANVFHNRTINKFRFVHGVKYGYDKVEMNSLNSMIVVTCSIHGDFRIKALAHANGEGCYKCEGTIMTKEARELQERKAKEPKLKKRWKLEKVLVPDVQLDDNGEKRVVFVEKERRVFYLG